MIRSDRKGLKRLLSVLSLVMYGIILASLIGLMVLVPQPDWKLAIFGFAVGAIFTKLKEIRDLTLDALVPED